MALLNSLRLVGETLVVLDAGLTPEQRDLLQGHAQLLPVSPEAVGNRMLLKAYRATLGRWAS